MHKESMKKITFLITVSSYYPGYGISGANDHINSLALGLTQRGHEVHIMHVLDTSKHGLRFTPSAEWREAVSRWENKYPAIFIHTIKSPLGIAEPLIAYMLTSPYINRQFGNIIREIKPNVVHYQDTAFLGHSILRKQGEYLSLFTAHDFRLICQTARLMKNGQRPCEEKKNCFLCGIRSRKPPRFGRFMKGFKEARDGIDIILSLSKPVKERLSLELDTRIELIPQIMQHPESEIEPSGYSNYFLFCGGLSARKGTFKLMETFSKYADQTGASLIITGGGKPEEANEIITKYGLQEKVIFLGWVDREMLWSLYKGALALIVPSIGIDPAPTTVLEALSIGTPVIGSDQGGIPEMAGKLDEDLIFPSDDFDKLGEILIHFDKNRYPPDQVKQVCNKWFSIDSHITRYLDIIENSIDSHLL